MRADVETAVRKAAETHGIEAPALLAVVDIESAGSPFEAADGATPCFLFERHIFYRELKQRAPEKLQAAMYQGLANTSWQPATQYKDQNTSANRIALLARAAAIDPECAYRSASFGLGQTMGFHAESLGYPSAQAMVEAMKGNLDTQVEAMVGEINHSNLGPALAKHDWATFARGYNGAGYRQNAYDTKLARAYAKWSGAVSRPIPQPSEEVKWVQNALKTLGADIVVDGFDGPQTEAEIKSFQEDHDLFADGIVGEKTRKVLEDALSSQTQENDPMSSWITSIGLWLLSNTQVGSLVRKALAVAGTALLVKFGLDTATANSILSPILDALGGVVAMSASLFYSAQNASPNITNPTLIKPDATPTA